MAENSTVDTIREMVADFQCPGCTCGSGPDDGCYKPDPQGIGCASHSAGTFIFPVIGCINLGLPKGFNRNGPVDKDKQHSII